MFNPLCRTYKYWRCLAIEWVVQSLSRAPEAARLWEGSLQLGAINVYMLNALTYRPGDKSWDGPLVNRCAVHTPSDVAEIIVDGDEDMELVATEPMLDTRGTYFLTDVILDGGIALRLPAVRLCLRKDLAAIYNVAGWVAMTSKFNQLAIIRGRGREAVFRPPRRSKWTQAEPIEVIQPGVQDEVPLTNINRKVNLRPVARPKGEDVTRNRYERIMRGEEVERMDKRGDSHIYGDLVPGAVLGPICSQVHVESDTRRSLLDHCERHPWDRPRREHLFDSLFEIVGDDRSCEDCL